MQDDFHVEVRAFYTCVSLLANGHLIYCLLQVRMPRQDEADPTLIVVMGKNEDNVLDCIDHIKNIEEEFMQVQ